MFDSQRALLAGVAVPHDRGSVGGEYSEAYMPLRIRESKLLSKAGLVYAVAARPAGNGPR